MPRSHWLPRLATLLLLGFMVALAACAPAGTGSPGTGSTSQATPTPSPTPTDIATPTPPPTPTPVPPQCNTNFPNPPVYYSTLPDATFKATNVFAQIPLPPLTRSFDNDASGGERGRQMCSAGTTDSILTFMTDHLAQLGWQQTGSGCRSAASYGHPQCWKNGTYDLFMGINSNTDWIILFTDPDFTA